MLRAYFDDSGTHGGSDIVVMAGVFGTESEMWSLEGLWQEQLDSPIDGMKPPIRRFHMVDCDNSIGEFSGWSRTETDYFRAQLQNAILQSHASAYGFACVRKDFDEIVQGDARVVMGDPEGFSVRNCFVKAIAWAQQSTFDPQMEFIFDDRRHRERENRAVFDAFQRWAQPPPELAGISFMTSHKVLPLQAADLVAWEFYQQAKQTLRDGRDGPLRPAMTRLKKCFVGAQMPSRNNLKRMMGEIIGVQPPDVIRQMAKHFRTFDPSNPPQDDRLPPLDDELPS